MQCDVVQRAFPAAAFKSGTRNFNGNHEARERMLSLLPAQCAACQPTRP